MGLKVDSFSGIIEAIITGYTNKVVPAISEDIQAHIQYEFEEENYRLAKSFDAAGHDVMTMDSGYVPANLRETAPVLNALGQILFSTQTKPYYVDIGGLGRGLKERYISVKLWDDSDGGTLDRRESRAGTRKTGRFKTYTILIPRSKKRGKQKKRQGEITKGGVTTKDINVKERKTVNPAGRQYYYWQMIERGTHKPGGYFVQEMKLASGGVINVMTTHPKPGMGTVFSPDYIPHTYYMMHAKDRVVASLQNIDMPEMVRAIKEISNNYEMGLE